MMGRRGGREYAVHGCDEQSGTLSRQHVRCKVGRGVGDASNDRNRHLTPTQAWRLEQAFPYTMNNMYLIKIGINLLNITFLK